VLKFSPPCRLCFNMIGIRSSVHPGKWSKEAPAPRIRNIGCLIRGMQARGELASQDPDAQSQLLQMNILARGSLRNHSKAT
jgi:hypothetical protein